MTVKHARSAQRKPRVNRKAVAEAMPKSVTAYRVLEGNPGDPQGAREYLLSEPLPLQEEYEPWLHRAAGPGRYRLEERDERGRVMNVLGVLIGTPRAAESVEDRTESEDEPAIELEAVEAMIDEKIAAILPRPTVTQGSTIGELIMGIKALDDLRLKPEKEPTPARDPLDEFRRFIEIDDLIKSRYPSANHPGVSDSNSAEALRLLTENPALAELLHGRTDDKSPVWLRLLLPLMPAIGQAIVSIVDAAGTFAQSRQNTPRERAAQVPGAAPAVPEPSVQNRTEPRVEQTFDIVPPEVAALFDSAQLQLVTYLIRSLASRTPIGSTADSIIQHCDANPQCEPLITEFLAGTPQEVLDQFARLGRIPKEIADVPGASAWIESLQKALTQSAPEGEEGATPNEQVQG